MTRRAELRGHERVAVAVRTDVPVLSEHQRRSYVNELHGDCVQGCLHLESEGVDRRLDRRLGDRQRIVEVVCWDQRHHDGEVVLRELLGDRLIDLTREDPDGQPVDNNTVLRFSHRGRTSE